MQPAAQPAPQQPPQPPVTNGGRAAKFGFKDENVAQFVDQVATVIDAGMDPATFAKHFVEQYPAESAAMIRAKPEELLEWARANRTASPVLRADGQQWVRGLWVKVNEELTRRRPN
jgi:hypothetical protein